MKKYSVCLFGHFTSITIEDEFFDTLKKIAKQENKSIANIIQEIDKNRDLKNNLSSSIRIYILNYLLSKKV